MQGLLTVTSKALGSQVLELSHLFLSQRREFSIKALLHGENTSAGVKSVLVEVEKSGRVLSGSLSCQIERLNVWEEPVRVAGVLQRWCGLVPNISCNVIIVDTHLNESLQTSQAVVLHATLVLVELAKETVHDALDAARLKVVVDVADHIEKFETILLDSVPEVRLGEQLRDAKDPFHALLLERVLDFEVLSDLLQSLGRSVRPRLGTVLQVCFCHLLADLDVVFSHVEEQGSEVSVGTFSWFDHLLNDVLVRDNSLI